MQYDRPIVISAAGFDPTGGAGVLADVKTIEQFKCLGFGVLTSTTQQTENEVLHVDWLKRDQVIAQLKPLLENYRVAAIKIGIAQNLEDILAISAYSKGIQPHLQIIWDPVLVSTSGSVFLEQTDESLLEECFSFIDVVTPNSNEIRVLGNTSDPFLAAEAIADKTAVFLKGGHMDSEKGTDYLFQNDLRLSFASHVNTFTDKHGTGCMLSSALAAALALGNNLEVACRHAKDYVAERANSNLNRLAYHAK